MDFPHLNDTQFPLIDNVNVYKYQNNFNYARWNGKVSIKLLNVLWNSNYADVPYFESVKERDTWFDSQDGYVGTLESLFNNTPENTIKIPIPYNDAYNYNYLVVDMPVQTSIDNPINYEDENTRVTRWFYFIEDLTQFAPSTTELQVSIDYWTTFIHSVNIPYLMLERGHAPMVQTKVNDFLDNPIMNNEYLLADDFNYGNDTVIQTSNYIPFGNGKKYVLFCAPYNYEDLDDFGGIIYSGNSTPPTYSDTIERWGYQIQVNDYEWKYGNTDYSNANLPIKNNIQTGIFNGCECYAIEGTQARAFFNLMAKNHVNFIHGIQAMFILDESAFKITNSINVYGYTIYIADRKINFEDINLTKEQFGFDEKYSEIAKLYTSPYSILEITDDEGNYFNAKIENCGRIQMRSEVSLVYPFLNYNVFFTGINGDGKMNYSWQLVQGNISNETMWASDFSKFMMNWNIPTYSIFVSAEAEYAANNFAGMKARRLGAIKDYENAVRFGNTTRENTADSFATSTGNVNRATSKNVANTQRTNTMNNNIGARENARDSELTDIANTLLDSTTETSRNRLLNDAAVDLALIQAGVNAQSDKAALTAVGGTVSSIISGGMSGGTAGAAVGAVNGTMNGVMAAIGFGIDQGYADVQKAALRNKVLRLAGDTTYGNGGITEIRDANKTRNTDSTQEINDSRYGTNSSIVGYQNDTRLANSNADKTCEDANATATQATETNNATWNRDANVVAEKANLVQKQREAEAQYKNARLQKPVSYSQYSGDFMPDAYHRRGVRVNVRTQSKSAIAQAGDAMLRFGYALHRVWDMTKGFHYCKEFTFWKAEDIWINDGSGVANVATNVIGNILMKGVTIWRDPAKIGTVGIYDNI